MESDSTGTSIEQSIQDKALRFKLDLFEGPLDLLLFLIKKNEIDIYDIPIESITRQYLEYIDDFKEDLDVASEYLVTAASLLYIKSRMLLPDDQRIEEEEEFEDPRLELVQKLLEYKEFKDAGKQLEALQDLQDSSFTRGKVDVEKKTLSDNVIGQIGIYDLTQAFHDLLKKKTKASESEEIVADEYTVEQKVDYIRQSLEKDNILKFSAVLGENSPKNEIVCVFLAILELIKLQEIFVIQKGRIFGEIEIQRKGLRSIDAPPESEKIDE